MKTKYKDPQEPQFRKRAKLETPPWLPPEPFGIGESRTTGIAPLCVHVSCVAKRDQRQSRLVGRKGEIQRQLALKLGQRFQGFRV